MKASQLAGARARMFKLLVAAGWPESIGPNDKRKTSHRQSRLDDRPIHTFWANGATGFFVLDLAAGLVGRGRTFDDALISTVRKRQNVAGCDSGKQDDASAA